MTTSLIEKLEVLEQRGLEAAGRCDDPRQLEALRVSLLGRKGELTEILRGLAGLPAEERPEVGKVANRVKEILTEAIDRRKAELEEQEEARRARDIFFDWTLPGRTLPAGRTHL
ncbi:MAG TPA: phenylalanine--tRNA ligase subunit alpha, partial [Candidatus Hydrogenedentes bacterium]|nr:phenylalanine--tRNA ligase subunit alpha [Candidatus Hydrogenedentota bacterium]